MPPTRSYLLDKLNKWAAPAPPGMGALGTLVLAAPNSTGKSHCLQDFTRTRNHAEQRPKQRQQVIYYEFGGGGLHPEQTCEHLLLHFISQTIRILDEYQNQATTFDQASLESEDGFTLFHEYLLFLLKSARQPQQREVDICYIIDSPERCVNASKVWALCRVWAELGEAKLIVSTACMDQANALSRQVKLVEIVTRLSFKPVSADEVIFTLFEEAFLRANGGDFDALDNDLLSKLTERCAGNVLIARLAIERKYMSCQDFPAAAGGEVDDNVLEAWYDASTWPAQLVQRVDARENKFAENVLDLGGHARDWFLAKYGGEEVYKQAHLGLARLNNDALFHYVRAADLVGARACILDFDVLYRLVQWDFSRTLLDVQAYCLAQPSDVVCRIVCTTLLDAKHALMFDARQLPCQFLARLSAVGACAELVHFLERCLAFYSREFSWFSPARASFGVQHEAVLRHFTIGANSNMATACCLDERAAMPNLLLAANGAVGKIFDLETSRCAATLVVPTQTQEESKSASASKSFCGLVAIDQTSCIAVIAMDKRAFVWYLGNPRVDFEYGKEHDYTLGGDVECMEFSQHLPNLVLLGNSEDCAAQLWQLPLTKQVTVFPKLIKTFRLTRDDRGESLGCGGGSCVCVAFVPKVAQNELVCTCFQIKRQRSTSLICLWNLTNEQCLGSFAAPQTRSLAFRSDGLKFCTGGADGVVRVWGVEKVMANFGTEKRMDSEYFLPHPTSIRALCFLEGGRINADGEEGEDEDRIGTSQVNGTIQVFSRNALVLSLLDQPRCLQLVNAGRNGRMLCAFQNKLVLLDASQPPGTSSNGNRMSTLNTSAISKFAASQLAFPLNPSSVTCAVINARWVLLAHKAEFCILELESGRIIKRLDMGTIASATIVNSFVIRNLLISNDASKLKAQFEGNRELVWKLPSFDLIEDTGVGDDITSRGVSSKVKLQSAKRKQAQHSWPGLFFGCCAALPPTANGAAAAAAGWQDRLILPLFLQAHGRHFVANEQFAAVTFDSKSLLIWRIPPHLKGNILFVVLESENGRMHVLQPNFIPNLPSLRRVSI